MGSSLAVRTGGPWAPLVRSRTEGVCPLPRRNLSFKRESAVYKIRMKEPLDGGRDKAVVLRGLLDTIKEEPDNAQEYGSQESELKISAVFSVSDAALEFQLSPLPLSPNASLPSAPSVAAQVFCSGCKKILYKGQTAYHKTGSTQLFCSTGCIIRCSVTVCPPSPPKKTCRNCTKDILNPTDAITTQLENSSPSNDFCSQSCLSSYELKKKPFVTMYTNDVSTEYHMSQKNADENGLRFCLGMVVCDMKMK